MSKFCNNPEAHSITNQTTGFSHQTTTSKQKRLAINRSLSGKTGLPKSVPTTIDVIVRAILACIIALCVPYALFIYMQTKEAAVLGLTTVLGIAVGLVYAYYFPRKRK